MEIFLPNTLFLGNVFIFGRAKNAQLLQALRGITISSSIQRNLVSVGKWRRADKRQYWFISRREVAVDLVLSARLISYVVKARISGVSHKCTSSPLLWNSGLLPGSCGSRHSYTHRHEVSSEVLRRAAGCIVICLSRTTWTFLNKRETQVSKACPPLETCLDFPSRDRSCPTNYINLGAWRCGKEGRMKEEGEGSRNDKSMPEKLVHTVGGLPGGWTWT